MGNINRVKEAYAPQKLLHELFDYNSITGVWVNKINRGTQAKAGQIAGTVTPHGYVVIKINGYQYKAHRLAWCYVHGDYPDEEQPYVDHINGIRDDNRIANLRVSSREENMRNMKMYSRNTSGFTGVYRVGMLNSSKKNPKINYYWVSNWYDENGKLHNRNFSIGKLSEDKAKQSAIDYRNEQIRLLELNHSIIYSERHGI